MSTYTIYLPVTDALASPEPFETVERVDRHQIDEHNNLHLMDEQFNDFVVYKNTEWIKFKILEKER